MRSADAPVQVETKSEHDSLTAIPIQPASCDHDQRAVWQKNKDEAVLTNAADQ
jgi:hypothetical protein